MALQISNPAGTLKKEKSIQATLSKMTYSLWIQHERRKKEKFEIALPTKNDVTKMYCNPSSAGRLL